MSSLLRVRTFAATRTSTNTWLATLSIWALALSPLAMIPGGLFRFTLPKLLVVTVGAGASVWARPAGRLPRRVGGLVLVGAGCLLAASAASAAPLAQLLGRWPRYEGLVALPVYAAALWSGARLLGPVTSARRIASLESALSVTALAVCAVSVLESCGLRPLGGDAARPGSFLGNATDQGVVGLIMVSVLVLPAWRDRRPLVVAGACSAAVCVVLSGSRGALLGAVVALGLVAAADAARASARRDAERPPSARPSPTRSGPGRPLGLIRTWLAPTRRSVPLVALSLLALASLLVPTMRRRLLGTSTWSGQSIHGRLLLWSDTVDLVRGHLGLGVGPSGFVDAISTAHSTAWVADVGSANPPDSPHSWPLQALAAGGAPLLIVSLAAVASIAVLAQGAWRSYTLLPNTRTEPVVPGDRGAPTSAARRRDELIIGSAGSALGCGITALTHFTTSGTTPLIAFLVGGLVAQPLRPTSARGAGVRARAAHAPAVVATVLACAWACALGLGTLAEISLARGTTLAAAGSVGAADSQFTTAATMRPWDRDVALVAAQAFAAGAVAGDVPSAESAVRWSRRALEESPDSLEAGRVLAISLGVVGSVDEGRRTVDDLVRRAPSDPQLQLAAGVLAAQASDIPAAEAHFTAAVRVEPTNRVGWQNLAIIYGYQGRDADARAAQATADGLP